MNAYYKGAPIFGPRGPAGPDGNPIGTVISYMGLTAPQDYLVCDGAVYSISAYPDLSDFFLRQFGSANHFGGDGSTTFAVPDLRNLFLRGYHGEAEEQLSGEVGERQEGTAFPYLSLVRTDGGLYRFIATRGGSEERPLNMDTRSSSSPHESYVPDGNSEGVASRPTTYTARPINMAVLYCIKAAESVPAENIYSTEETRIGTWIDGRPLYKKVIEANTGDAVSTEITLADLSSLNMKDLVSMQAVIQGANGHSGAKYPVGSGSFNCVISDGYIAKISYSNADFSNQTVLLTIEYTKTTD